MGTVGWRDRLGGRWAFSWRASLVGSALISLLIIVRGSALSGSDPSPSGVIAWVGVALVAVAAKSAWQFGADRSILQQRHNTQLSLTRVFVFYSISGLIFGAGLVIAELWISPEGSTASAGDAIVRAVALAAATVCWYVVTTILFDARERFWRQREQLLEELVASQMAQIQEEQVLDGLRDQVRADLEQPLAEAKLLTATALLENDDSTSSAVPERLRELASGSVRSLSHEMMEEQQRHYSQGRLRDVWKTFALEIRFAIGPVLILIVMAYAIDTAVRNQSQVGIASTIAFSVIGAVCMWLANKAMDRAPTWRIPIYTITFVVMLVLALMHVSGVTFAGLANGELATIDMSWAEVGFLVLLASTGLLGTSYAAAVLSNREQVLDRLREDADLSLAQEIANAQRLASTTRQLGSELHGALQTRLLVCAGAIDSALANEDADARRDALNQAWDVLKTPLESQQQAGSIQECVDQRVAAWTGLLDVRCKMAASIGTIGGSLARSVDVVIEEGLANAYRHGDATRVDVNIWVDGNDIVVEIIDDGRGLGDIISGMGSQRMAAVGALSLTAHTGGGTALTVAVSR
ncbi:MAG: hypothetical protein L7U42_02485 [Candidatus Nanopelagicales bacterium]|nr:hypothetical protein [Candidatus Nanopelagicales bacterium]